MNDTPTITITPFGLGRPSPSACIVALIPCLRTPPDHRPPDEGDPYMVQLAAISSDHENSHWRPFAIDDREVKRQIYDACRAAGIPDRVWCWCHVEDDDDDDNTDTGESLVHRLCTIRASAAQIDDDWLAGQPAGIQDIVANIRLHADLTNPPTA